MENREINLEEEIEKCYQYNTYRKKGQTQEKKIIDYCIIDNELNEWCDCPYKGEVVFIKKGEYRIYLPYKECLKYEQ